MSAQVQLQTVTFLLKCRDFDGDSAKIMEAAGLRYFYFDFLELDDWGLIDLTVYWCGCSPHGPHPRHPVYVSCWYQYRTLCYGINKDPRRTPETCLSITFRDNELNQADAAIVFAKIFEGTELEIEGGPIEAPAADFVEKLHKAISA